LTLNRVSRGVPLPTVGQLLIASAVVCTGWLGWSEYRGTVGQSLIALDTQADQVAAAVANLQAVEAIAQNGPDAIPELVAALTDSNSRIRRNAVLVLRRFGPGAGAALGPVRERLADEDGQVRYYAVETYWHICRDSDDVARVVAPMLGDRDPTVQDAAARVLETIGPPAVPPVVDLVQSDASAARVPALRVLRRIGWEQSQTQFEDPLRRLARDPNAHGDVHLEALQTLAWWGSLTGQEIRNLLQYEPADDVNRRSYSEPGPHLAALYAIIRKGPGAADNLPDVLGLLERESSTRWASGMALAALWNMKHVARPAVPRLYQLFDNSKSWPRWEVAWTIAEIDADHHELAGKLLPLLADANEENRFRAGRLLADIDPEEARRQVKNLIPQLAADTIAGVQSSLDALWGLAPVAQAAIPALLPLLDSPNRSVASVAIRTLGDIGPDVVSAVPALLAILQREQTAHDRVLRDAALTALGKMTSAIQIANSRHPITSGDDPDRLSGLVGTKLARTEPGNKRLNRTGDADLQIFTALREQLLAEGQYAPIDVLVAAVRHAPESPALLQDLLSGISRGPAGARRTDFFLALTHLQGDRRDAVPDLTGALEDFDPEIRKLAAFTLGTLGPQAKPALASLQEALVDWQNSFYTVRAHMTVSELEYPQAIVPWRGSNGEYVQFHARPIRRLKKMSVRDVIRQAIAQIDPAAP